MPDRDGYALIRQVRVGEGERGERIAAIALTAFAGTEARGRALVAGVQAHVPKPIEPAELATVVANLTGRNTTR
ncbi:MAG: hypothetical protein HY217_12475 [Candidatus Rokubacteria bacterium]|nr:hypothetical protein [Candidatus Rokubacteria bacterium]